MVAGLKDTFQRYQYQNTSFFFSCMALELPLLDYINMQALATDAEPSETARIESIRRQIQI